MAKKRITKTWKLVYYQGSNWYVLKQYLRPDPSSNLEYDPGDPFICMSGLRELFKLPEHHPPAIWLTVSSHKPANREAYYYSLELLSGYAIFRTSPQAEPCHGTLLSLAVDDRLRHAKLTEGWVYLKYEV